MAEGLASWSKEKATANVSKQIPPLSLRETTKGATMVTAVTKGVTRKSGSALLGAGQ